MDEQAEQERLTYSICRIGFLFLSVGLAVACVISVVTLPRQFGARPFLPWLVRSRAWAWADTPVVWFTMLGSYLLWGRWQERGWQRRTGLLCVMSMVDVILWFLDHGQDLGLRFGDVGHHWLRIHLGQALGWAEFALLAGLSSEVMVHLGVSQAAETGRATRSLSATGAAVWMLLFLQQTDWSRWPLEFRRFFPLEAVLLDLGSTMIWTITLLQVTALTMAATRQCNEVLDELRREAELAGEYRSASEDAVALLTGRSEVA